MKQEPCTWMQILCNRSCFSEKFFFENRAQMCQKYFLGNMPFSCMFPFLIVYNLPELNENIINIHNNYVHRQRHKQNRNFFLNYY